MAKITVLGPVSPFRGGIARHTTRLAKELAVSPSLQISIFSFASLYPKLLYPGQHDRDQQASPPDFAETQFVLNSLNPLSWYKTAAMIAAGKPDTVVVPAWTFFVAPGLGQIAKILRQKGVRVIQIVHNANDHEAAGWKNGLMRYQLRQADAFVTHNDKIGQRIRARIPNAKITICAHPIYDDYPEPSDTVEPREDLELLFFGLVRHYKGLDIALRALAASKLTNVRLTIAGEFWEKESETRALVEELGLSEKVEFLANYVSDQEAADLFARADAAILPYRAASGSGVVALAQNYDCPIIASDIDGLNDAIKPGVNGWLFPNEDVAALADLLSNHVSRKAALELADSVREEKKNLGWDVFAEAVLSAGE